MVITGLTRNQLVGGTWHAGSNPAVSALTKNPPNIALQHWEDLIFLKYLLLSNICLPHLSRLEVV